jgi:hypothetical protein
MVVVNVVFTTDYKSIPRKDDLLYNSDALPIVSVKQMFRCNETFMVEWDLYKPPRSFQWGGEQLVQIRCSWCTNTLSPSLIIAIPR